MPRRSARNQAESLFEIALAAEKSSNLIVGEHMKKQILDLMALSKKELPHCDICTEKPCKCCVTWLVCGHCFCSSCILKLPKAECPICKWSPP